MGLILRWRPFVFRLCLAMILVHSAIFAQEPVRETWSFPAARQLDGLLGEWNVVNRLLQSDGTYTEQGDAYVKVYSVLDGKALLEFWQGTINENTLYGFSLRYYDRDKNKWIAVLNWPRENAPGLAEITGTARHGRVSFFSETTRNNQKVITRRTFSDIAPTRLRWDGASSRDNGLNWRTNWIQEYSRAAEYAAWPVPGEPFHTAGTDERCTTPEPRRLDPMAGDWTGTVQRKKGDQWHTYPARMQAYKVLGGCSLLMRLEMTLAEETFKVVALYTFFNQSKRYRVVGLDNRTKTGLFYQNGTFEADTLVLTTTADGGRRTEWHEITADSIRGTYSFEDGDGGWQPVLKLDLTPIED